MGRDEQMSHPQVQRSGGHCGYHFPFQTVLPLEKSVRWRPTGNFPRSIVGLVCIGICLPGARKIFFFFKQMSILFVVLPLFCPQKGHVSRRTGRGSIMPCSVSVFVLCSCVRVHACVCMGVRVRACAAQPASSANAPWKTNSVSVDSISRQRSSSDPPAVHPPLPPLRVTSTSTFFFPFFLSCHRASYNTDGWWGGVGGGPLGCPGLHAAEGSSVAASLRPPSSPAAGCCLSHSPRGSPPPLLHLQALQQHFFLSTSVPGLPLAVPCFGAPGCVPVDSNLLCVSLQCHVCTRGRVGG